MRPGQREAVAGAERSAALVSRQPGRVPFPRVHRPGLRGGALGRAGAGGPHAVRGCWAPPSPILGPSCRDRAPLRLSGLFLILFGVSKGQKIRWEAPTCCPGCRFMGRLMGRHLGHPVDLGGGLFPFQLCLQQERPRLGGGLQARLHQERAAAPALTAAGPAGRRGR